MYGLLAFKLVRCLGALALGLASVAPLAAGELATPASTVNAANLRYHVEALANDTFEGREAGSRGGRAAAGYITQYLAKLAVQPAGEQGTFFQTFQGRYRNILVRIEGSDPQLKDQVVIVGAHYDHVGYGTNNNSHGPIGYIHNGADDNASGDSTLLELIASIASRPNHPKRTILFAFWDGEEKGLLGSKHWVQQPTLDLQRVAAAINIDMVGRLGRQSLTIYGFRSRPGFRRLISDANRVDLPIDFNWEIKADSDHYTFYERSIPFLMIHTGLHSDYHRPSDDAEKIDYAGLEHIANLLVDVVVALADEPGPSPFRAAVRGESPSSRLQLEQPLAPLSGRLGASYVASDPGPGALVESVQAGLAGARSGLRVGDRVVAIQGENVADGAALREALWAASNPVQLRVRRAGQAEPVEIVVTLDGSPIKVGIAWGETDAEPGSVLILRVVPGSPADKAGLKPLDRLYRIDGKSFASVTELADALRAVQGPFEALIERDGRERTLTVPVRASEAGK